MRCQVLQCNLLCNCVPTLVGSPCIPGFQRVTGMAVNLWQATVVNANSAALWVSRSAETAIVAKQQPTVTCKQAIKAPIHCITKHGCILLTNFFMWTCGICQCCLQLVSQALQICRNVKCNLASSSSSSLSFKMSLLSSVSLQKQRCQWSSVH